MLIVPTYLAESGIPGAGLGLFAKEPIEPGTVIWRFDPILDLVVTELPADPVRREFVMKYGYVPLDGPYRWIICLDNARFINHSGAPNTVDTPDETIAITFIPAGTELTSDYRSFCREPFTGWDSPSAAERTPVPLMAAE